MFHWRKISHHGCIWCLCCYCYKHSSRSWPYIVRPFPFVMASLLSSNKRKLRKSWCFCELPFRRRLIDSGALLGDESLPRDVGIDLNKGRSVWRHPRFLLWLVVGAAGAIISIMHFGWERERSLVVGKACALGEWRSISLKLATFCWIKVWRGTTRWRRKYEVGLAWEVS